MPEFLLEIGCEEIPAGWLRGVTEELGRKLTELAQAEHLKPDNVAAHSTPRRLVLRADVLARQPDQEQRIWGPLQTIAMDESGNWKPAGLGFAKKQSVRPEDLGLATRPGQDLPLQQTPYVYVDKKILGREASEVLQAVIQSVLRGLVFPKRMSWDAWLGDGKGAFPFGRPIRWLVALLDGVVVPFQIHELVGGSRGRVVVEAGDKTCGHRFFPRGRGGETVRVRSAADLADKLRERCVVLSREERAAAIRSGLAAVERQIVADHGLLEDWADLVEHPAVVIGQVPDEFQGLPRAVLETVLVHHQKYIPLSADGRTVSGFAAVTDTDGSSGAVIVRGMQRVVIARLRDAAFFFEEDRKRPLIDRVEDLAGVSFHAQLGSYKDKAERLVRLIDALASESGRLTAAQRAAAREAALLAKADLTTLMVREFTELQGVMGGIYLRAQGAPGSVAAAVEWHYHPLSIEEGTAPAGRLAGDELAVFAAVSIADKLDTLAGYFAIGQAPTGSSDPYGLRRAAQGLVRVLIDFWRAGAGESRPSLRRLLAEAVAGHPASASRPAGETARDLEAFLLDRIRYVFVARRHPPDEVEAVLGAREPDALEDPHEAWVRLLALRRIRSEAPADFASLAIAFKRAKNILEQAKQAPPAQVEPDLLEADAERALYAVVSALGRQNGGYESRLRALAALRDPVDRFFDPSTGVFVMSDDLAVRGNRLALLAQARALFYKIADISKLGG